MKRYCPNRVFPPYSFIPTQNLNPNRIGGYRQDIPDPVSEPINKQNFFKHKDYLFAIDLLNYGYYWESHVYFEAIWHAHKRKGEVANYCKAMVKIAAGAIKHKQGRSISSKRLFKGANKILKGLSSNFYLGITISELIKISGDYFDSEQLSILLEDPSKY